jgi:hypothetical protein
MGSDQFSERLDIAEIISQEFQMSGFIERTVVVNSAACSTRLWLIRARVKERLFSENFNAVLTG